MFFAHVLKKQLIFIFMAVFLTACSEGSTEENSEQTRSQEPDISVLDVYKSPSCGCCVSWVAHIEENGLKATTHNRDNLSKLKTEMGIKPEYRSCHTAITKDGYVFEGHIPAKIIQKFLREKPEGAIGLAVPGMPVGSPGMEQGNYFTPYDVLLLMADGSFKIYAQIKIQAEQYQ
jgi:hypothetical protein